MNEKLKIEHMNKSFPVESGTLEVLNDITLTVQNGEFISIVGYSGCGKSTLLRIVGGLEIKDSGIFQVEGKNINGPGLDRGMIFQESRLFPWLKVRDNVLYGLSKEEKKKLSREEREKLVKKYLELVELNGFEDAYPKQLSGGMQQRASIARTLIGNPDILLLDEPFGALDAITRINMQQEIIKIWQNTHKTMILVTHDIDEAVYLSDRVVVLSSRPGKIKKMIDIELPRPRQRTAIEFSELRRKIFKEFIVDEEIYEDYVI
ncbi:ABC transporter ATP-binding protein [bacterium]|nr:ABC transporter ATP-binding protein [bacterium]MDY3022165.1 ABC transporter ATP-binding protein [Oliverpabstia sp.]